MRSTLTFIAVLFGLSFFASGIMLVTATLEPQLFMIGKKPAAASAADTTMKVRVKKDTLGMAARALADSIAADSLRRTVAAADSANKIKMIAQRELLRRAEAESLAHAADSLAQAENLQRMVKLYEAMKPDDAAKILARQPDDEVRSIILHIKKKQAAKILSAFAPERAAQILAQ